MYTVREYNFYRHEPWIRIHAHNTAISNALNEFCTDYNYYSLLDGKIRKNKIDNKKKTPPSLRSTITRVVGKNVFHFLRRKVYLRRFFFSCSNQNLIVSEITRYYNIIVIGLRVRERIFLLLYLYTVPLKAQRLDDCLNFN